MVGWTQELKSFHTEALHLCRNHREVESELVRVIGDIDRTKLYRLLGVNSLFKYCVQLLGLTESVSYAFILVARKSKIVPPLEKAIVNRQISVALAARIAPVLNLENAEHLIEFARTHSSRETEVEVARINPKKSRRDSTKILNEKQVQISGTVYRETARMLERTKSLLAQRGKPATLDSVLSEALGEYLKRHDPVQKAERAMARAAAKASTHSEKGNEANEQSTVRNSAESNTDYRDANGKFVRAKGKVDGSILASVQVPTQDVVHVPLQAVAPEEKFSARRSSVAAKAKTSTLEFHVAAGSVAVQETNLALKIDTGVDSAASLPSATTAPSLAAKSALSQAAITAAISAGFSLGSGNRVSSSSPTKGTSRLAQVSNLAPVGSANIEPSRELRAPGVIQKFSLKPNRQRPKYERVPLTARENHLVQARSQGRCEHVDSTGKRCGSDRWIEIHHVHPVSRGGANDPSNLMVLCSECHTLVHQLNFALDCGEVSWLRAPRKSYTA